MKNLSSSLNDYDALVVVATQLTDLNELLEGSVTKDLHAFSQVRMIN